ncbi:hypothetical protein HNO86_22740 [Pseudomonas sp. C1C7]|uniref:hypothetical protein n=1 Tax=Pseudomonas sp. C1C7 TaxID=2735272 RepID=UPI001586C4CB|nr:hypothetical protein [Pseudomonas sp. C1C7]NUT77872.1 hypothetical protein [Pseudomonas sp. C1C7]
MKILINLQVGSVRVSRLATPFAFDSKAALAKIYLETIEVVDPAFSVQGFL